MSKKKTAKKTTRKVSAKKSNSKASVNKAKSRTKDREQQTEETGASSGFNLFKTLQSQIQGVAGASLDRIPILGTLNAMLGDRWLKTMYINPLDPRRLQAMAEAGKFLKESREVTGLTVSELAQTLGLSSSEVEDVENGKGSLSMETIFRLASLTARHDPIPFVMKFLRTYNPTVESAIDKLGLPKHFERERRFVNLYRKKDNLRQLSDEEYLRLLDYLDSAADLILGVMENEKEHQG